MLATLVPLRELQQTPLPIPFSELSPNAQKNLKALCRAFETSFDGIRDDGWDHWKEEPRDATEWGKVLEKVNQTPLQPVQCDSSEHHSDTGSNESVRLAPSRNGSRDPSIRGNGAEKSMKKSSGMKVTDKVTPTCPTREKNNSINAEERKSAERIKNWAQMSSHKTPPQEAMNIVSKSSNLSQILQLIVPHDASPLLRAAVISSFTEKLGTSMASLLMEATILPYVQELKAPAPREVMKSVVTFCSFHWRSAIMLFSYFAQDNQRVNGAIAELLSRVGSELEAEAALSAFKEYCTGVWGEDGIRVVEALLSRCKEQPDVLDILMPSLEKNVIGMEKSVRFGKLLFTIVKDLPVIENQYAQLFESVAERSKVFLAKRALSLLRTNNKKK